MHHHLVLIAKLQDMKIQFYGQSWEVQLHYMNTVVIRIIRNPWFSRVFTRKAKQLVPTLDPRAAATSAAMLEPWTWNCSASYATSCQVFLAMHVACGPSKSFQGGCGVIFKVPTVSRTPYPMNPMGVLFLQGCSSTGIQWKYNETSTSPSSTKTIKIAQHPCYPLFKLFKSIQGPKKALSGFRISSFLCILCKTHGETNFELNPRTRRFSR